MTHAQVTNAPRFEHDTADGRPLPLEVDPETDSSGARFVTRASDRVCWLDPRSGMRPRGQQRGRPARRGRSPQRSEFPGDRRPGSKWSAAPSTRPATL